MLKTPLVHIREKTADIVPSMRWDGKENFQVWSEDWLLHAFMLFLFLFCGCKHLAYGFKVFVDNCPRYIRSRRLQ